MEAMCNCALPMTKFSSKSLFTYVYIIIIFCVKITFFLTDLNAVDWDVPIAAIGVLLLSQHTLSGQFRQQHLFKVSSLNLD